MDNNEQHKSITKNALWEIVAIIAILLVFMGLFYVVLAAVVKEFATP